MLIFLDTASLEEIRSAARLGVVKGVTTNPSLLAKEDADEYRALVEEICSLIPGPVSVEAMSQEAEDIVEEARSLSLWAPNVVVKIPITPSGLEATSRLSREGVKVNQTLIFSTNQAILAAEAGASYVSPFVGRIDDVGHDGMALVAEIKGVFLRYQYPTRIIAASIRHPRHCVEAARAGADIATVPYKVLMQMIEHPLTKAGIARFLEDWQRGKVKKVLS